MVRRLSSIITSLFIMTIFTFSWMGLFRRGNRYSEKDQANSMIRLKHKYESNYAYFLLLDKDDSYQNLIGVVKDFQEKGINLYAFTLNTKQLFCTIINVTCLDFARIVPNWKEEKAIEHETLIIYLIEYLLAVHEKVIFIDDPSRLGSNYSFLNRIQDYYWLDANLNDKRYINGVRTFACDRKYFIANLKKSLNCHRFDGITCETSESIRETLSINTPNEFWTRRIFMKQAPMDLESISLRHQNLFSTDKKIKTEDDPNQKNCFWMDSDDESLIRNVLDYLSQKITNSAILYARHGFERSLKVPGDLKNIKLKTTEISTDPEYIEMVATQSDNCHSFIKIPSKASISSFIDLVFEHHNLSKTKKMEQSGNCCNILILCLQNECSEEVIEEMLGSIHKFGDFNHHNIKNIFVLADNLQESFRKYLGTLKAVSHNSISDLLYSQKIDNETSSRLNFCNDRIVIINRAIERLFAISNIGSFLIIEPGIIPTSPGGFSMILEMITEQTQFSLEISNHKLMGIDLKSSMMNKKNDWRGFWGNCEISGSQAESIELDWKTVGRGERQLKCYLENRIDLIKTYSEMYSDEDLKIDLHDDRISVAFLVTSRSKNEERSVLFDFIESLYGSINQDERKKFRIIIYIGYDRNDPFLDNQSNQNIIGGFAKQRGLETVWQILPPTRSLTTFWNVLFERALQLAANQYFYVLNDDVFFLDSGWLSPMISDFSEGADGLGVIGHKDVLWDCKLLTQMMVSRVHWDIFGYLFPSCIKDWYSDVWLSTIYVDDDDLDESLKGKRYIQCLKDKRIKNGGSNHASRYEHCMHGNWRQAIIDGQDKVMNWRKMKNL